MTAAIAETAHKTYRNWGAELDPPIIFESEEEALASSLGNEYAGFDMGGHNLMINKEKISKNLGWDLFEVILSHEVGHHSLAPYDLENMIYMIHQAKQVLGSVQEAKLIENLFTDTIVNSFIYKNDQKNRQALVKLYNKMSPPSAEKPKAWKLYLRTYEKLWNLTPGTLVKSTPADVEQAAGSMVKMLAPRDISDIFQQPEWQDKVRKYAEIMKPFINEEKQENQTQSSQGGNKSKNGDAGQNKTQGSSGKGEEKKELGSGIIIHRHNPASYKQDEKTFGKVAEAIGKDEAKEIYAGLGLGTPGTLEDSLINSLAELYTIRLPKAQCSKTGKKFIGYKKVSASKLIEADIPFSVTTGGRLIPGYNTFARRFKEASFKIGNGLGIPDLIIALDTSGSMQGSAYYSVLAAKIAANSTLYAGGAVAVSNFSGQCIGHEQGFMRDKKKIYKIIERQQNGGTVFPVQELAGLISKHNRLQYLIAITDTAFSNVEDAVNGLRQVDSYLVGGAFLLVNTSVPLHNDLNKFNYDIIPVTGAALPKEINLRMRKVLNYGT